LGLTGFRNKKRKRVLIIVKITKREKNHLESVGFKFHRDIFKTHTSHPTYFSSERECVKEIINNYRKSKLINERKV